MRTCSIRSIIISLSLPPEYEHIAFGCSFSRRAIMTFIASNFCAAGKSAYGGRSVYTRLLYTSITSASAFPPFFAPFPFSARSPAPINSTASIDKQSPFDPFTHLFSPARALPPPRSPAPRFFRTRRPACSSILWIAIGSSAPPPRDTSVRTP